MRYKTLNGWTTAKMIEAIKRHVPDKVCIDGDGACVYLREDGKRCAIGAFLSDKNAKLVATYRGSIDEVMLDYESANKPGAMSLLDTEVADGLNLDSFPLELVALEKLQSVHDDNNHSVNPKPALIEWINKNVEDGE